MIKREREREREDLLQSMFRTVYDVTIFLLIARTHHSTEDPEKWLT